MVSPYIMHHHPRYWENPEQFHPKRFETHTDSIKAGYFPFGGGPRVCIGNHFAMMEMMLVLATMLRQVDLTLVAGQTIVPHPTITLRPEPGIRLMVRQREQVAV